MENKKLSWRDFDYVINILRSRQDSLEKKYHEDLIKNELQIAENKIIDERWSIIGAVIKIIIQSQEYKEAFKD